MTVDRKGFLAIMMFLLAGFIFVDAVYFFALKAVFPIRPLSNYSYNIEDDRGPYKRHFFNMRNYENMIRERERRNNRENIEIRSEWFRTVLIIEGIVYIAVGLLGGGFLVLKGKIEWKGKTET